MQGLEVASHDGLGACGVGSAISTSLVATSWTAENFARVAREAALDPLWGELVPDQDLSLLQKSALRTAFKRCPTPLDLCANVVWT